jgi:hypothetical protein
MRKRAPTDGCMKLCAVHADALRLYDRRSAFCSSTAGTAPRRGAAAASSCLPASPHPSWSSAPAGPKLGPRAPAVRARHPSPSDREGARPAGAGSCLCASASPACPLRPSPPAAGASRLCRANAARPAVASGHLPDPSPAACFAWPLLCCSPSCPKPSFPGTSFRGLLPA